MGTWCFLHTQNLDLAFFTSDPVIWFQKINYFNNWNSIWRPPSVISVIYFGKLTHLLPTKLNNTEAQSIVPTDCYQSAIGVPMTVEILSIYLRAYSLHHNVLQTLQSIPLMTNGPLYPITQDSSCHGQHAMPRNPWSFPWPCIPSKSHYIWSGHT